MKKPDPETETETADLWWAKAHSPLKTTVRKRTVLYNNKQGKCTAFSPGELLLQVRISGDVPSPETPS